MRLTALAEAPQMRVTMAMPFPSNDLMMEFLFVTQQQQLDSPGILIGILLQLLLQLSGVFFLCARSSPHPATPGFGPFCSKAKRQWGGKRKWMRVLQVVAVVSKWCRQLCS